MHSGSFLFLLSSEFRVYSSLTRQTDQDSPISRSLASNVFILTLRQTEPRPTLGSTEARARTHHHRGRKPHHPCHPVGCMPSTSGGRGGGAPVGGAPEAEPSARAGLWKRGGSLRGADDQPRLTASSARSISLICQRTRASGRLRTRLPCGAGGGRQATHRIISEEPPSSSG